MDQPAHFCDKPVDNRVASPPHHPSAPIEPLANGNGTPLDVQMQDVGQSQEESDDMSTLQNNIIQLEERNRSDNNTNSLFFEPPKKPKRTNQEIADEEGFCDWIDGVFSDDEVTDGDAMDVDTEQNTASAREDAYIPTQQEKISAAFTSHPGHGPGYGRLDNFQREAVNTETTRLQREQVDVEAAQEDLIEQDTAVMEVMRLPQVNRDISHILCELELSSRDVRVSRERMILDCPELLQRIRQINHNAQQINNKRLNQQHSHQQLLQQNLLHRQLSHQQRLLQQQVNRQTLNSEQQTSRITSSKASSSGQSQHRPRPVERVEAVSFIARKDGKEIVVSRRYNDIDPMLAAPMSSTSSAVFGQSQNRKDRMPTVADFACLAARIEKNVENDHIFCLHEQWRGVLAYIEHFQPYIYSSQIQSNNTLVVFSACSKTLELRFSRIDKDDVQRYELFQTLQFCRRQYEELRTHDDRRVQETSRVEEERSAQSASNSPRILQDHAQNSYRHDVHFPELAISKIRPAKEQSVLEMFKDNMFPENADFDDCTFCLFDCDYGVYEERFWLDSDSSTGYCSNCHRSPMLFMDLWGIEIMNRRATGQMSREELVRLMHMTEHVWPLREHQAREDAGAKCLRNKRALTPAVSQEGSAMDFDGMHLDTPTISRTSSMARENTLQVEENLILPDVCTDLQKMQGIQSQQGQHPDELDSGHHQQHDLYQDYPNSAPVATNPYLKESLRRQASINRGKATLVQHTSSSAGYANEAQTTHKSADIQNQLDNSSLSPAAVNQGLEDQPRRQASINSVKAGWRDPNHAPTDRRPSSPWGEVREDGNVQENGLDNGPVHIRGGAGTTIPATAFKESSDEDEASVQLKTTPAARRVSNGMKGNRPRAAPTIKQESSKKGLDSNKGDDNNGVLGKNGVTPGQVPEKQLPPGNLAQTTKQSTQGDTSAATPKQSRKRAGTSATTKPAPVAKVKPPAATSTTKSPRQRVGSSDTANLGITPSYEVKAPSKSSAATPSRQRADGFVTGKPNTTPGSKVKTSSIAATIPSTLKRGLSAASNSDEPPSKKARNEASPKLYSHPREALADSEAIIPAPPVSRGFTRRQSVSNGTNGTDVARSRGTPEPKDSNDAQDIPLTPKRRKRHDNAMKSYRECYGDQYEKQQEKFKAEGRQVTAPVWTEKDLGFGNGQISSRSDSVISSANREPTRPAMQRRGSSKGDGRSITPSSKTTPHALASDGQVNGFKSPAASGPRKGGVKPAARQSQGGAKSSAPNAQHNSLPKAQPTYTLEYIGPERGVLSDQESKEMLNSCGLDIYTVLDSPIACISPYTNLHTHVVETGVTMADIECATPMSFGTWKIVPEKKNSGPSTTNTSEQGQARRASTEPQMFNWSLPKSGPLPVARQNIGSKRPDLPSAISTKSGQRIASGLPVQVQPQVASLNPNLGGPHHRDSHNPRQPSSLRHVEVVPPSPVAPTRRSPYQDSIGHMPRGTPFSPPPQPYHNHNHNYQHQHHPRPAEVSALTFEKLTGILFCRGCPWRQVDVTKARICKPCKDTKLAIIMHRHDDFIFLDEVPLKQHGYFAGDDLKTNITGKKLRACMVCTNRALWVCRDCPLRVCTSCKVELLAQCKGKVENLLMHYGKEHVRNDVSSAWPWSLMGANVMQAFLLRADGGGF